jgi:hypothetical protein
MNEHVYNHALFQPRSPLKRGALGRYTYVYIHKFKEYQAHNVHEMMSEAELEGKLFKTTTDFSIQLEDPATSSNSYTGGWPNR